MRLRVGGLTGKEETLRCPLKDAVHWRSSALMRVSRIVWLDQLTQVVAKMVFSCNIRVADVTIHTRLATGLPSVMSKIEVRQPI